jgi:aryl-alcohol dehydrogenase-like predicted oxidoreductase
VKIATKFGLVSHAGGGPGVADSSAANVKAAVEGSLQRLGTDHIDLYYQHRIDRNTPIERELSIGFVPYSPLGHGLLTGQIRTVDDFAPIPGTRRVARVEENTAADAVELTPAQVDRLNALRPAAGARHDAANMAQIDH